MLKVRYIIGLAVLLLVSCSQKPSLQKYFVEKSNAPGFFSLDLGADIVKNDKLKLSPEEAKALKSLKKLNVLGFKATPENQETFEVERDTVNSLIKKGGYDELMRFGSGKEGVSINSLGDTEHIDEFVVFGNKKENGFIVLRVLGDNMTPNDIMTLVGLLQKADFNSRQLKSLMDVIK